MTTLTSAAADGVSDPEEREEITWLCERLKSTEFYDMVTAYLPRLHALFGGIASDGAITTEEMRGLSDWMSEHDHLRTCRPYDEIEILTTTVLGDGRIDERTIVRPMAFDGPEKTIGALCAVAPEVSFAERTFCFTDASAIPRYFGTGAVSL